MQQVHFLLHVTYTPLPLDLAINFAREDNDVNAWTVWNEEGWATLFRKCPRIPNAVFRDVRSFVLFQHLGQHMQQVHFLPTLRHLHANLDRSMVKKIEYLVQLQHQPTCLRACLTGIITLRIVLLSLIGVSAFHPLPPDGLAAIKYSDVPPSIAHPTCIQSGIEERDLHREGTLVAHKRRPEASLEM